MKYIQENNKGKKELLNSGEYNPNQTPLEAQGETIIDQLRKEIELNKIAMERLQKQMMKLSKLVSDRIPVKEIKLSKELWSRYNRRK